MATAHDRTRCRRRQLDHHRHRHPWRRPRCGRPRRAGPASCNGFVPHHPAGPSGAEALGHRAGVRSRRRRRGHRRLGSWDRPAPELRGLHGRRGGPPRTQGPAAAGQVRHHRRRSGRPCGPGRGGHRCADEPLGTGGGHPRPARRSPLGRQGTDAGCPAAALARLDRAGGAARRASPAATRGAGGPMRPVRPAACSADPVRVTKLALRSIARRWRSLSEEIGDLDRAIEPWSPVPLPGCSGSTVWAHRSLLSCW